MFCFSLAFGNLKSVTDYYIWGSEPSLVLGGEDPGADCQDTPPDTDATEERVRLDILPMCFVLN